ncbi:DEKNAAC101292 [Brettanomyces naardenensis]|uniref:DEKNAAC101292 n=1 Tax=Brettanomyces naardenensis TaxID=13370 RepID=A0A448YI22_BRENA|nr:DEKNAAC101292 [Brettanomyces naardenensis]
MALTRILADNYLHRNYEIMNRVLNQHSTLFVGDLFDGGREWDDTNWFEEYARFHRVFNKQSKNRAYMQVPGNHDVGFGSGIRYDRYKRFVTYFGDANTYITLGNHSIVLLDTVSLSDTENIMVSKSSTEFLNSLEDDNHPSKQYPRIVITHVPLYRSPDLLTCGPFRESTRPFPIVRGNQYQTVIDYTFTRHILDWIKPKLVLSGDDHDYCHVRHPINRPGLNKEDHTYEEGKASIGKDFADEITVKSSAMTGGIKRPAVQLLSLWNPDGTDKNPAVSEPWEETGSQTILHDTFESELCYLPDFLRPLIWYGILAAFSFVSLFSCTMMPRQTAKLEKIVRNLSRLGSTDILPLSQGESNGFRAKQPGQKFLTKLLLDWELPLKADWQAFLIHLTIWIGFVIFTFYWSITAI